MIKNIKNKTIKDILYNDNYSGTEKKELLNEMKNDIITALIFLDGNWAFCPECKDYYLNNCFFVKEETETRTECVYEGYINSSDNVYQKITYKIDYQYCPKGHKKELFKTKIKEGKEFGRDEL